VSKKKKNTAVKYKPFGIATPCGLINHDNRGLTLQFQSVTITKHYILTHTHRCNDHLQRRDRRRNVDI